MRRDLEPSRAAHAHPFDAVKEAADQRPPVDPDFGQQRVTVVFEAGAAGRPPGGLPANRVTPMQPQTKADPVTVLSTHGVTRAGYVQKQCEAGSQPRAN